MQRWIGSLADIYQSIKSLRGTSEGVYSPAPILETIFLIQHWRLGPSFLAAILTKSLLALISLKQYRHILVFRRIGVYTLAALFVQQLSRSANYLWHKAPAAGAGGAGSTGNKHGGFKLSRWFPLDHCDEPTSIATLSSSLLTLYVNAQRKSCGDLALVAACLRVVAGFIRIKMSDCRRNRFWSTMTTIVDSCILIQIMIMQRKDLPQILLWPESLSDIYTTVGTVSRSMNVKSGRLTYVRSVANAGKVAFLMPRHRSGIFSRPDRHMYFHALQQLQHPNVHRHEHFIEDWRMQYFVLEYVTHIPLIHFIDTFKRIPEGVGNEVLQQILQALAHIHDQNVTHRDVKIENIFVNARAPFVWKRQGNDDDDRLGLCHMNWDEGSVLLTNFDKMATHISKEGLHTGSQIGTAHYAAPEIQKKKYNCQVDVWSLAVSGFVLLCAEFPFDADPSARSGPEIVRVVCRKRRVKWPVGSTVSFNAKEAIESMLHADPTLRPTAAKCMEHRWFSEPRRICGGLKVDEFSKVIAASAHSPNLISLRRKK